MVPLKGSRAMFCRNSEWVVVKDVCNLCVCVLH